MRKINILYLISSLSSGGAQRQLVELAKNIDKNRYRVFIAIFHNRIHYKYILDEDVEIVCIEKKYKLSRFRLWRLIKFIQKNKIDIIHSYMYSSNLWGRLAGKISNCKTTISSIRSVNTPKWQYFIEQILSKFTTVIITNSHAARDEYFRCMNLPSNDFVRVIPNGIDIDAIEKRKMTPPAEIKGRYNINPEDFVVVQVAGINQNKNQLCLLKAVKQIRSEHPQGLPSTKVLLVGSIRDKRYYNKLRNYVEKHHLENIVSFLGEQQDVFSILNIADLFVLTSLQEAFPNAVMEAMAMELPIISSKVGDLNYLVKNGRNGYCFQKDSCEELAGLLKKMIEMDVLERDNMGAFSRQIIKNYTVEKMVKKTSNIYDEYLVAEFRSFNRISQR